MIALRKAWLFVKVYWYVPFILILVAVFYSKLRDRIDVFSLLKGKEEFYRKEILIIEENNKKKDKIIEENIEKYIQKSDEIEKEYKENTKKVKINRDDQIKTVLDNNNLDDIASEIRSKYDWR